MDLFNLGGVARHRGELIIVDDSTTVLAVMERRLTRMGYAVTKASDGMAGLEMLETQRFDAMLLDMSMPMMSGLSVLRAVRQSPATSALPVLMMTSRSDPDAAITALREGADDHVVKPFDFDVLGARIEHVLARAQQMEGLRRLAASLDGRMTQRAVEIRELRLALADAQARISETI